MIPIFWLGLALYTIIGIGYSKTLKSLTKEADFAWSIFSMALWPVFLVVASFWNFNND